MNWYKIAKIGEEYLKAKGVPSENIDMLAEYLHSLPDNIQRFLMKNYITKNPTISIEELKAVPLDIEEEIKVSRTMEKLINQMTHDKSERNWLKKLVQDGRFQKEDYIKIQLMLDELRALPEEDREPITKFKDDVELSDYLNLFKVTKPIKDVPEEGAERIESYMSNDYAIDVYYITNQEALDAIGNGASWCVLSNQGGNTYHPFEYYCFVINGQPEILLHTDSDQIKDRNDGTLNNGPIIKAIAPVIEEYGLNTHEGDFWTFDRQLREIKEIEQNIDNKDFIYEKVIQNPINFKLLPESEWGKHIKSLAQSFIGDDSHRGSLMHDAPKDFEELGKDLLHYLAGYLKLKDPSGFARLEDIVTQWLARTDRNLTVGRYRKVVPDILHTTKVNNFFRKRREEAMQGAKDTILNAIENKWKDGTVAWEDCFFEEVKNDPEVLEEVKDDWKRYFNGAHPEAWKEYYKRCPFNDVIEDEELWKDLILGAGRHTMIEPKVFDRFLESIPSENIKNNVEIWKKYVLNNPEFWEVIHLEEVKNDPEVMQDVKWHWEKVITQVPSKWALCPFEDVKAIPELKQASITWWKRYLIYKNPSAWKLCPHKEVKEDYEVRKNMLLNNPTSYRYLYPSQLKEIENDPAYWKEKLLKTPNELNWKTCPFEEVKQDPEVKRKMIDMKVVPASTQNRLWSTAFNDNFIGLNQ